MNTVPESRLRQNHLPAGFCLRLSTIFFIALTISLRADTSVVFNEIMYHPPGSEDTLEWVEFYNQMAVDVDVTGWSVAGGIQYIFPSNSIVRGGGYLLVARSPATIMAATGLTNVYGPFSGRLANEGEAIQLLNNSARVVDEVTYGVDGDWPVAPDGSGVSLAKRDPDTASGPADNWTMSEQIGGTPGAQNFTSAGGFAVPPGLVSYWNFNETAGTNASDQVGPNFGTLGSGVAHTNAGIIRAFAFDGSSNAYVNVGAGVSNSFAVAGGITIETVLLPGWSGNGSAVIFRKAPRKPGSYRDAVLASQPLAYWRLGDTTTTMLDSTANAHNGTATAGMLLQQPGLIPTDPTNKAVSGSGGNRITVPGFEKIGPGGYTVEYWLQVHQLPGGCCQNIVGDGESTGDFFLMDYILGPWQGQTGAIRPHFGYENSPSYMDTPTALQVDNTYHIVATWDATSANNNTVVYINGVPDLVSTVTQNLPAPGTTGNNSIYIGPDDRESGDGSYTYDEVAIYNHALTAAEVSTHYLAATLTNFDQTLGNAIQVALQNDGHNAQANPPVAPGPVLSFGLTVGGVYSELDMPLDGLSGRPTLAGLEDGLPHHVAVSYNSATGLKAIYVDGVQCFSVTLSGAINANNGANAIIGNAEVNGTNGFTGILDETAYWSRALSPSEIAAHFAAVLAGRDYFTPAATNIATTLAFNELSASTNSGFWLELVNYGTNAISLAGYVIVRDGTASNEYVFPSGPMLGAGGFLAVTNTTLGFHPVAGDRLYLLTPARDRVLDAVTIQPSALARFPAATGPWLHADLATPGGPNHFSFHSELVINEIMYHHALLPETNGLPPQASSEGWIELFNRSGSAVDLTGWTLDGGIQYAFPNGKSIGPGGYLVVAKDATALHALYPAVDVIGNFSGKLSHKTDLIVLRDPAGNPANQVRYYDGGHWPEYADGGGSSLELRDPGADNSQAEAWAASDESGKAAWQTYSYRLVAQNIIGPEQWNDFVLGLLAPGECLVDDISVIESPATSPVEFIGNGDFENGLSGWRVLGTHNRSRVETDPDNPGNHVLHVIATGPQEHMHNHIETTYLDGRAVTDGLEYQISFRAKWLAGNNLLNTRLYFDRVARTTPLPVPPLNGTPGAQNSRFAANIGPTFSQFQHRKVIPQPGELVTVSVVARDPQGVSACSVWWSVNGGDWSSAPMAAAGDGSYAGTIPGYPAGSIVQFYVQATDGLGASATWPAGGPDSGALYTVADGQANLNLGHNLRIILTPANTSLLHAFTNVMSNDNLPCTVVYDEQRAYYDMGVRLKGSERGRADDGRVSFHLEFRPEDLFRGVHPVMLIDRSRPDSGVNQQNEIIVRHMLLRAGNIPGTQPDMSRVIAPMSIHTGPSIFAPRNEDEFIETAYTNGGDGIEYEMELVYYPYTADPYGYKYPQPDNVWGTDISDLGKDKEMYRYDFIIKNHRDVDDYRGLISFARTFSLSSDALLEAQTRQFMDMNEWVRAYAIVSLCGVFDSYTFGDDHNLFLYLRPSDQKMLMFPWDMDYLFRRSPYDPLIGDRNLGRILNLPVWRRLLYAHALDIIGSTYNTSYMTYWVNHYAQFAPGQDYTEFLGFIAARTDAVNGEIDAAGGNAAFALDGPTTLTTDDNLVTLSGTAPVRITTILINGVEYPVTWTSVSTWSIRVPVSAATNQLNVVGYDLRGNALSNVTVIVNYTGPIPAPAGAVVFNEIMDNPAVPGAAYVELFNASTNESFDLSGWRIDGLGYTFPPGSIITNGQFLVLARDRAAFLSAYGPDIPCFDQFPGDLPADGATLTLFMPGGTGNPEVVVDRVRYEATAPWPSVAPGVSLQLIDPAQDNSRVANWAVAQTNAAAAPQWVYFSTVGTISSSKLYIYLQSPGDVYVDDIELVAGSVPDAGVNVLDNGDFESPLTGPWNLTANFAGSALSTAIHHSGTASLHVVASAGGTGNGNAIYEDITPSLPLGATYALSFWYLQSTNGGPLTIRLSSSGISATVDPAPPAANSTLFTPGTSNSVAAALPGFAPVWLNELQADNVTGPVDNFSEHDPWIELFNAGTNALSLANYFLSDSYTNLTAWSFPPAASIPPGGFVVVWCDNQTNQTTAGAWHTGFRLNSGSGRVALSRMTNGAPQLVDYLNYTNLPSNWSYGDIPDGQPFYRFPMFFVTPGASNNAAGGPVTIFINEWMADNVATLADPADNDFEDWFELYNPGTNNVDLGGYYLTDALNNKFQFAVPNNGHYLVPAGGYLLVWADGEAKQNSLSRPDLHVSFKLDKAGEAIGLFTADGTAIDAVTFGPQITDVSQGRFPDGAAHIVGMTLPTPRAANRIPNTAPTLNPIGNLYLHSGQTAHFTATSTDAESAFQTLTFSLDAGAPVGTAINSASGVFTWVTTNAVVPGTNLVTIRVTDNGTPPLSDSKTVAIIVRDRPLLNGTQTDGTGNVTFNFHALPGQTYRVEYMNRLDDAAWVPLISAIPGADNDVQVVDDMTGQSQRFYRIVVLPY